MAELKLPPVNSADLVMVRSPDTGFDNDAAKKDLVAKCHGPITDYHGAELHKGWFVSAWARCANVIAAPIATGPVPAPPKKRG